MASTGLACILCSHQAMTLLWWFQIRKQAHKEEATTGPDLHRLQLRYGGCSLDLMRTSSWRSKPATCHPQQPQVIRSSFLWGSMRLFWWFQIRKCTRRSPTWIRSKPFRGSTSKHDKDFSWKDELLNLWRRQGLASRKWTFWWYWGKYTTRTPPTNEALANLRK